MGRPALPAPSLEGFYTRDELARLTQRRKIREDARRTSKINPHRGAPISNPRDPPRHQAFEDDHQRAALLVMAKGRARPA